MKRLTVVLVFLLIMGAFQFSVAAENQQGQTPSDKTLPCPKCDVKQMPPCCMQGGGQQMPPCMMGDAQQMQQMMPMCQTMMSHMKTRMKAADEAMGMMKDMMKIQEKALKGASKQQRKKMSGEVSIMIEKMDKMLAEMRNMPQMPQCMMMKDMPAGDSQAPKAEPKKDELKKDEPHRHHK